MKKSCVVCGRKFDVDSSAQKFCSDLCRSGKSLQTRKTRKRVCAVCGKRFYPRKSPTSACSVKCGRKSGLFRSPEPILYSELATQFAVLRSTWDWDAWADSIPPEAINVRKNDLYDGFWLLPEEAARLEEVIRSWGLVDILRNKHVYDGRSEQRDQERLKVQAALDLMNLS